MFKKKQKPAARRKNCTDHSYDPETQELTVTFHTGRRYKYLGVSQAHADGLRDASSQGTYLHQNIVGTHSHKILD